MFCFCHQSFDKTDGSRLLVVLLLKVHRILRHGELMAKHLFDGGLGVETEMSGYLKLMISVQFGGVWAGYCYGAVHKERLSRGMRRVKNFVVEDERIKKKWGEGKTPPYKCCKTSFVNSSCSESSL
jgi:hypothetical protein